MAKEMTVDEWMQRMKGMADHGRFKPGTGDTWCYGISCSQCPVRRELGEAFKGTGSCTSHSIDRFYDKHNWVKKLDLL